MTPESLFVLAVALIVLAYLGYALLFPERL